MEGDDDAQLKPYSGPTHMPKEKKKKNRCFLVRNFRRWRDALSLILRSAQANRLKVRSLKEGEQDGEAEYALIFDSYTALKKSQRRLRIAVGLIAALAVPLLALDIWVRMASLLEQGEKDMDPAAKSAPSTFIYNVKVSDLKYQSALVSWETAVDTTYAVQYGKAQAGEKKEISADEYSRSHSVLLEGLEKDSEYEFVIKGMDETRSIYISNAFPLHTPSSPEILTFKLASLTEGELKASLSANGPVKVLAKLHPLDEGASDSFASSSGYSYEHTLSFGSLVAGARYVLEVEASDEGGHKSLGKLEGIVAKKDNAGPEIDNVRSETAVFDDGRVQAIVSWNTDEAALSKISYREGKSGAAVVEDASKGYATKHAYVSIRLKPGATYYFTVEAEDLLGQKSVSREYTMLIPRSKSNEDRGVGDILKALFNVAGAEEEEGAPE